MGDLMTLPEAAAKLGRGRGFVIDLIADKLVVGYKRGNRWYVNRASLDAWLRGGAPDPTIGGLVTPPRVWGSRQRRS